MSLNYLIEKLQNINKGRIVLIKVGIFYIAKGRDAVLLNKLLSLKTVCLEKGVCKVGFPINSLEKYLNEIEKINYSYIVYNYDKNTNRLDEIRKKDGKLNEELEESLNCLHCKSNINNYNKNDKYLEALNELLQKRRETK